MPWARCTSAVLIRMSTLPPISPAICFTDRESVKSSGNRVDLRQRLELPQARELLPGLGIAHPHQIRARRAMSGAHDAPGRPRFCRRSPALCGILDHRSFHAVARSSAILGTSSMGKASSTPWPDLSRRAPTRTRHGGGAQPPCRCATTVGPASRQHHARAATARRSRKNGSWLWCTVVVDISSPEPGCSRHAELADRQRWHASRGGYCTAPQASADLQLESAERGGCGEPERRARAGPRAAAAAAGCAGSGFLRLGRGAGRNHASARPRMAAPEHRPRS